MAEERRSRQRAVRLTQEALSEFADALNGKLEPGSQQRRPSRRSKAEFLQVSERTLTYLLENRGVDRNTLVHAFERVDLPWSDTYLERKEPTPTLQETPTSTRKRFRTALILGTCVIVISAGASLRPPATPKVSTDQDWLIEFAKIMTRGTDEYHAAKYAEARVTIEDALGMAKSHQSSGHISGALRLLADIQSVEGDLDAAAQNYKAALDLRKRIQDEVSQAALMIALAGIEIRRDQFASAKELLREAILMAERHGQTGSVVDAQCDLGTIAFKRRDWDEALSWFASARVILSHNDLDPKYHDVRAREALVHREQGRLKEARTILESCLNFWQEKGHPRWIARMKLSLGTVELKLGNRERARVLFQESRDAFARINDKASLAEAEGLLGV